MPEIPDNIYPLDFYLRKEREKERQHVEQLNKQKQIEDEKRIAAGRRDPLPIVPEDFLPGPGSSWGLGGSGGHSNKKPNLDQQESRKPPYYLWREGRGKTQ